MLCKPSNTESSQQFGIYVNRLIIIGPNRGRSGVCIIGPYWGRSGVCVAVSDLLRVDSDCLIVGTNGLLIRGLPCWGSLPCLFQQFFWIV